MANSLINWFKNKITFINNSLPAINGNNLNKIQSNIEEDLSNYIQGELIQNIPISNENLESTNLKEAIDELSQGIGGVASDVTYDNTTSGLTSENIQGAIDELVPKVVSNSNGTAIKFPNGIMMCIKKISITNLSVSTANGNIYLSADKSLGDFAATFKSVPTVTLSLTTTDYNGFPAEHKNVTTSSAGTLKIGRGSTTSSGVYTVNVIAVGTWK